MAASSIHKRFWTRTHDSNARSESARILVSLVVAGLLTQATAILIARLLGVEDFGIYSIIVRMQAALGIVAMSGMRIAMAKLVSQHLTSNPGSARYYVRIGFTVVTVSTSVCVMGYVGLSDVIANDLYDDDVIAVLIPYSALVIISTAYHSVIFGVVQGERRISLVTTLQIAPAVLTLVLVLALAPQLNLVGILLALFLGKGIVSVGVFLRMRDTYSAIPHADSQKNEGRIADVLHLSIPSMISTAIVAPILWLGSTELTISEGFEAMGLLAGSLFFFNAIQILPQAIVIPLIPRISDLSTRSKESAANMSVSAVRNAVVLLFPLVLFCCLFAEEVVVLVFGQGFSEAGVAMSCLSVASFFAAIASILGGTTAGLGKMWHSLGANIVWGISFTFLVFLLVPIIGLIGMGIAFVLSYLMTLAAYTIIVSKCCGLRLKDTRQLILVTSAWLLSCLVLYVGQILQQSLMFRITLLIIGLALLVTLCKGELREYGRRVRSIIG